MGNFVEFNDTLQITTEQGFPADVLNLGEVNDTEAAFQRVKDVLFSFSGKSGQGFITSTPYGFVSSITLMGSGCFGGTRSSNPKRLASKLGPMVNGQDSGLRREHIGS